jgi:translation initiation factor 2B subunit (eIF-2B alpha/beta/delta family)
MHDVLRRFLSSDEWVPSSAEPVCGANYLMQVIQDYTTPPNNTLSRHLMTHLSVQISHLVSARPMSVTMGNAIRQLKLEISGSDIDLPEQDVRPASPSSDPAILHTLTYRRRTNSVAK